MALKGLASSFRGGGAGRQDRLEELFKWAKLTGEVSISQLTWESEEEQKKKTARGC